MTLEPFDATLTRLTPSEKIMPYVNVKVPAGSLTAERPELVTRAPTGRLPGLRRTEQLLGTSVNLDIRDPFPGHLLTALADEVFCWLRHADALFSIHRVDSEVSRLDQGMLRPSQADPLVREVLNTCARLHQRTNGFFDVHTTGWLDPSGYVTGWALQRTAALLIRAGAVNFRLWAGDDLYIAGRPEPGQTWSIPIPNPFQRGAQVATISATDLAVATSSSATGSGHILNPMTRHPATGLASVTVAGPDLGIADAYATAAFAMGPAALDWLPQLEDHGYIVMDSQGQRYEDMSAVLGE